MGPGWRGRPQGIPRVSRVAALIFGLIALTASIWVLKVGINNRIEERHAQEQKNRLMTSLIECESGGKHAGVWGDHGASYGILQFKEATFYELAEKANMNGADWMNQDHQIALGEWAIDNGYGNKWSCYRRIKK